jgi:hypothetical protein
MTDDTERDLAFKGLSSEDISAIIARFPEGDPLHEKAIRLAAAARFRHDEKCAIVLDSNIRLRARVRELEAKRLEAYSAIVLAEQMYTAYGVKAGWKAWDGKPMPSWAGVGEVVQGRWEAAAEEAIITLGHGISGLRNDEELAQALANFGVDIECEVCASIFYTGSSHPACHTCGTAKSVARMTTIIEEAARQLKSINESPRNIIHAGHVAQSVITLLSSELAVKPDGQTG